MDQKIERIEDLRIQAKRASFICLIPLLVGILAAIVLTIIFENAVILVLGVAVSFVIYIIFSSICYFPKKKHYVHSFKLTIVKDCLNKVFSDVNYEPDRCFDKETIKKTFLVCIGNIYKGNDFISAVYKDVRFSQCDLDIQEIDASENSTYIQYFLGKWIILDFDKKIDTYIQIRENEFGGVRRPLIKTPAKAQKIMTESVEFNKHFSVFADDAHNAFYILTPRFMEALLKLRYLVDGQIMLAFCEGKLHIALHNQENAFEPSINQMMLPAYEQKIMAEILIITQIIDELIINLK
ncbi:MAG TPA: DUF3137 domain-containing protein [Clostridia bacterium]